MWNTFFISSAKLQKNHQNRWFVKKKPYICIRFSYGKEITNDDLFQGSELFFELRRGRIAGYVTEEQYKKEPENDTKHR